jgi:hypothetical protein
MMGVELCGREDRLEYRLFRSMEKMGMGKLGSWSLGWFVVLTILGGCTGNRTDLVRNGEVDLDCRNSSHVRFSCVHVWKYQDEVTVYGHVQRCSQCKRHLRGCVHVEVCDPDGAMVCETEARCVPVHVSRHCAARCRFRASLPDSLPPDACVRLEYHTSSMRAGVDTGVAVEAAQTDNEPLRTEEPGA